MATVTTRLGLRKPDPNPVTGDFVDVANDLNNNWDIIDGKIGFTVCTSGTRPATPFQGQHIYEADTGNTLLCVSTGPAVWKRLYAESQSTWLQGFDVTRAAASPVFSTKVTGDAQQRLIIDSGGVSLWGSGAIAGDTNLYRSAADTLKTDDTFVAANLTTAGAVTATGNVNGSAFIPAIAAGYMYSQTIYFTGSGSFVKATYPGLRAVMVELAGGGGGGGGAGAAAASNAAAGGGGGGGGYSRRFMLAATLAASETVTIGAAGTGGAAGANNGVAGGTTSLGALLSATGGALGTGNGSGPSTSYAAGGDGGVGSGGDLILRGGPGDNGCRVGGIVTHPSFGGQSFFGPGRRGSNLASADGQAALSNSYGGGGSGGHDVATSTARAGGTGAAGILMVHIYI